MQKQKEDLGLDEPRHEKPLERMAAPLPDQAGTSMAPVPEIPIEGFFRDRLDGLDIPPEIPTNDKLNLRQPAPQVDSYLPRP